MPSFTSTPALQKALIPRWLEVLLGEKFFSPCLIHELAKKNEKNTFCLDCCIGICPHCLSAHRSHRLLQIRRYVYNDVIRLDDAEKLIDCAAVQAYTANSAKVVFLNQRPQTRPFRGSGNTCNTCDRSLQDPFLFCSLSCKVVHLLRTEGGISNHLLECSYLPLPELGREIYSAFDNGLMTPDSVLEPAGSVGTSSGSSGGSTGGVGCRTIGCTATTEIVRKKRSSLSVGRAGRRPACSPAAGDGPANRRKISTPRRSPLY
ncbi:hypothetical protein Ancab_037703 [Ancistrocladus abbreviatus]